MTHLLAFTTMIIGTGILAKVLPTVLVWVFNRFPAHFKPQESPSSLPQESSDNPVLSTEDVMEALRNPSVYGEPQRVGAGHILIPRRDSDTRA